jgi:hypothetical protein
MTFKAPPNISILLLSTTHYSSEGYNKHSILLRTFLQSLVSSTLIGLFILLDTLLPKHPYLDTSIYLA